MPGWRGPTQYPEHLGVRRKENQEGEGEMERGEVREGRL